MPSHTQDALEILEKINAQLTPDQIRLKSYVSGLREVLEEGERAGELQQEELAQYRAAYEKLTQPANRIGVFLKWVDTDLGRLPMILLGESEYIVTLDPAVDESKLLIGQRVRLNEGYSIIGLAPAFDFGGFAKVTNIVDEKRIRIGSDTPGTSNSVVLLAAGIKPESIKVGNEVRLDSTGKIAVEIVAKSENRDYFLEKVPDIGWDQVGGQEKAIQLIRETIEQPLLYPEIFERFGKKPVKGILLYGPPGCGKTLIGKAVANNLAKEYSKRQGKPVQEYFMAISGPKILNMWVGETERMVREIFQTAREKAKEGFLVFIFMDEAESILRTRSSGRYFSMSNTVVPQFCAELDGLEGLDNVVLILTSNRPDYIDPAILRPGRIDRKVRVERPNKETARDILNIHLNSQLPIDPVLVKAHDGESDCARRALIEKTLEAIWKKSEVTEFATISLRNGKSIPLYRSDFISGAIIENIVDRAKQLAIRRSLEDLSSEHGLSSEDMESAVESEFKENEIFPKTDSVEDWLSLLGQEIEGVVAIQSKKAKTSDSLQKKQII